LIIPCHALFIPPSPAELFQLLFFYATLIPQFLGSVAIWRQSKQMQRRIEIRLRPPFSSPFWYIHRSLAFPFI